jgi:hypothetical protein
MMASHGGSNRVMPGSALSTFLTEAETALRIAGYIVAGSWAYFKFFKGRTFKPRLDIKVSARASRNPLEVYLVATLNLKNIGLSKVHLFEGSGLELCSQKPLLSPPFPLSPEWESEAVFQALEKHEWVEPGESIEDQVLIVLPSHARFPVLLELLVVVKPASWRRGATRLSARTIVQLETHAATDTPEGQNLPLPGNSYGQPVQHHPADARLGASPSASYSSAPGRGSKDGS